MNGLLFKLKLKVFFGTRTLVYKSDDGVYLVAKYIGDSGVFILEGIGSEEDRNKAMAKAWDIWLKKHS